jgi:hypothetical protein
MTYDPSDAVIQRLVLLLRSGDPATRRNAAGALRLNGARALPALSELTHLLDDDDPLVQHEARRAIERLRTVAA